MLVLIDFSYTTSFSCQ